MIVLIILAAIMLILGIIILIGKGDNLIAGYNTASKEERSQYNVKRLRGLIGGFFEYVVPPLEGLWWAEDGEIDYANKEGLCFISMIRLPDFVTEKDVQWAIREATRKKKMDFSQVEFFPYDEGLCVQCMHIGSYDDEPATIKVMVEYAQSQGYQIAIDEVRRHHEIYLGDPRKTSADKLKTVIRYPIC